MGLLWLLFILSLVVVLVLRLSGRWIRRVSRMRRLT
nr:MAG TPA: chitin synthase regulator [Caudoviricetes sp.]DAX43376.1 MAG TPA: chitin synthase regulator [Caudoviricetes sp.]